MGGNSDLRKANLFAGIAVGLAAICAGLIIGTGRLLFLIDSKAVLAPIVSVSHEYVPRGRGSVSAYVPTVRLPMSNSEVKVDTWSEKDIYAGGQSLSLRCEVSSDHPTCVESSDLYYFLWPLILLMIGGVISSVVWSQWNFTQPTSSVVPSSD